MWDKTWWQVYQPPPRRQQHCRPPGIIIINSNWCKVELTVLIMYVICLKPVHHVHVSGGVPYNRILCRDRSGGPQNLFFSVTTKLESDPPQSADNLFCGICFTIFYIKLLR